MQLLDFPVSFDEGLARQPRRGGCCYTSPLGEPQHGQKGTAPLPSEFTEEQARPQNAPFEEGSAMKTSDGRARAKLAWIFAMALITLTAVIVLCVAWPTLTRRGPLLAPNGHFSVA